MNENLTEGDNMEMFEEINEAIKKIYQQKLVKF